MFSPQYPTPAEEEGLLDKYFNRRPVVKEAPKEDPASHQDIIEIFRRFDTNGDGFISKQELGKVFQLIDPVYWNEARVSLLFEAADVDGDHRLRYSEFVAWLHESDQDQPGFEVDKRAARVKPGAAQEWRSFSTESFIQDQRSVSLAPGLIRIEVEQSQPGELGLAIGQVDAQTLMIKGIKPTGLLAEWAARHPETEVVAGDHIVGVNGVKRDATLFLRELKKTGNFVILVEPAGKHVKFNFKIDEAYNFEPIPLARDDYGMVRQAQHKVTRALEAVRSLAKSRVEEADFQNSLVAMKTLDHPNILKLYALYEDFRNFHMVTELCHGGPLLERILEEGHFSERIAARCFKQVCSAVAYMHANNFILRNVCPEALMMQDKGPLDKCVVKVADLMFACKFEPEQVFRDKVGSPMYNAPEKLIRTGYDYRSDNWSLGVILYFLISGYPPFAGQTDAEVASQIRMGVLRFPEHEWHGINQSAKEVLSGLLTHDATKRWTAAQALGHRWFQDQNEIWVDPPLKLAHERMRAFVREDEFKRVTMNIIARNLSDDQVNNLKEVFLVLDQNKDGKITCCELAESVSKIGHVQITQQLVDAMQSLDINDDRQIGYTEFIAATLDRRSWWMEEKCWEAFNTFDKDGSGKITLKELTSIIENKDLQDSFGSETAARVLKQYDTDHDGVIDFREFVSAMRGEDVAHHRTVV